MSLLAIVIRVFIGILGVYQFDGDANPPACVLLSDSYTTLIGDGGCLDKFGILGDILSHIGANGDAALTMVTDSNERGKPFWRACANNGM
jgi:hypothetical protein